MNNNIRVYPGKVKSVNSDYTITFYLPGVFDQTDTFPTAAPMFHKSHEVFIDDDILIWQLSDQMTEFMYLPYNPNEDYTGLQFGNTIIDISDGENITLKVGEMDDNHSMTKILSSINISNNEINLTSFNSAGSMATQLTLGNIEGKLAGVNKQIQCDGVAAPTGTGVFCGLPTCAYSGVPHVGNLVTNGELTIR